MKQLLVETFTRLPELGDRLANLVAGRDPKTLYRQEIILLDGKALSNWLTDYLVRDANISADDARKARRGLGIHMNAELMNLHRFAPWVAGLLEGEGARGVAGEALENLHIRVHRLLCDKTGTHAKAFADCMGEPDADGGAARWELARRLADFLRELTLDDPVWTRGAQAPRAGGRLEALWRDLRAELGKPDDLVTATDVAWRLQNNASARARVASALPGRINLIGTGNISRATLHSLDALSGVVEVRALFLQPSLGYHDKTDWYTRGGVDTPGGSIVRQSAQHYEAQQAKLLGLTGWEPGGETDVDRATPTTLLETLQASIELFDSAEQPQAVPTDDTISIHRCHTPLREVEVLRDQILAAMAADPTLSARDILVLSPEPETYGPLMQGVLAERDPGIFITTVAIEGARKSPLTALAETLLGLPRGRVTAPEVLDLCELKVIRDRFGWSADDLQTIRRWLGGAPFLWGTDGSHRQMLVGEDFAEWSLDDFRRRLVLGTAVDAAMPLAGAPGTLPMTEVEGWQEIELAGQLLALLETLQTWTITCRAERSLAGWSALFGDLMKSLLPEGRHYQIESAQLMRAIAALDTATRQATAEKVGLSLFASHALAALDLDYGAGQFLSGGVVLAPLRSGSIHPAKVVCLLGMRDGIYPRRGTSPGPELATALPCVAMRTREQSEERGMHAIILAIGAASQRLIVTFTGYAGPSGKEASAALPAEMIKQACQRLTTERHPFRITRHPLLAHQGIGEGQDEDAAQTTYDSLAGQAAEALRDAKPAPAVNVGKALKFDGWGLDDWIDFWRSPMFGALNGLNARTAWTTSELPHEEAIMTLEKDHDSKRAREDWFAAQHARTGAIPSWEMAMLSGLFADDGWGQEHYGELAAGARQTMPGDYWDDCVKQLLGLPMAELQPVPSVTSRRYAKLLMKGPLLVLIPKDDREIDERDVALGIVALTHIRLRQPQLRHVAVFGHAEREKQVEGAKDAAGDKKAPKIKVVEPTCKMGVATREIPEADGLEALRDLGRGSISQHFFIGSGLFKAALRRALFKPTSSYRLKTTGQPAVRDPKKRPQGGSREELEGNPPYSFGDMHYKGAELVLPPDFDFNALNSAVDAAFGSYELIPQGQGSRPSNVTAMCDDLFGTAEPTKPKGKSKGKKA